VLCASALLFTTNSVSAQTTSLGTIAGTITDQTNAVISGATVTIKDTATRAVRTTSSNYAGQYVFVNVHPGTYDITIFKPSFSKVSIPHDLVQLGPLSTHNVILRVGSDSQTLEVAATGVELQSDNATVGNRVPALALNALPSIGRDTSTFTTLQPGITPDGSVAGVAVDQSSLQLDGATTQTTWTALWVFIGPATLAPHPEASRVRATAWQQVPAVSCQLQSIAWKN